MSLSKLRGTLAAIGTAVGAQASAAPTDEPTLSPTVVGGTRAAEGEFPFMVRLTVGCGGSC